jgi:hypothetical protein
MLEAERNRLLAAAKERAAQREREQFQYQGDETARRVAQTMWRDFLADPMLCQLSGRELKKRYPLVSHVTGNKIRDWIFSRAIFPAELIPRRKRRM